MQAELIRGCRWEQCCSGLPEKRLEPLLMAQTSIYTGIGAELGRETLTRLWGVKVHGKSTAEVLPLSPCILAKNKATNTGIASLNANNSFPYLTLLKTQKLSERGKIRD